jgi:hypothetical protein
LPGGVSIRQQYNCVTQQMFEIFATRVILYPGKFSF